MSLFKVGVSRLSKPLSAEHLGDEAETQKVMSQKCIENMGSVVNIYKGQAALICGRNYPANAINCL